MTLTLETLQWLRAMAVESLDVSERWLETLQREVRAPLLIADETRDVAMKRQSVAELDAEIAEQEEAESCR